MRPLISFIRAIWSELSNIASNPLKIYSFNLVKYMLFLRIYLYALLMFAKSFLIRNTHSDSCFPSIILSISTSPVLNLTGLAMIFGDSFIMVDCMSVLYVAV